MARAAKPYLMLGLCVLAAIGAAVFIRGGGGSGHEYDSVVTGTVTVDGSPAKSGTVVLHPEKTGQPAIGRIHSDGSYSLRTGQGNLTKEDGGTVASGDYVVTASVTGASSAGDFVGEGGPPKPGRSLIDSKYATKDSSDFRFAVKPGRQVIDLRLKSASLEAATTRSPFRGKLPTQVLRRRRPRRAKRSLGCLTKIKSPRPRHQRRTTQLRGLRNE